GEGSKSRWEASKPSDTAAVSARVSVHTEYTRRPPGFTDSAAKESRADWTEASSRTSRSAVVQRACGLRCQVPTPLQGASTSTPSHRVLNGARPVPAQDAQR